MTQDVSNREICFIIVIIVQTRALFLNFASHDVICPPPIILLGLTCSHVKCVQYVLLSTVEIKQAYFKYLDLRIVKNYSERVRIRPITIRIRQSQSGSSQSQSGSTTLYDRLQDWCPPSTNAYMKFWSVKSTSITW